MKTLQKYFSLRYVLLMLGLILLSYCQESRKETLIKNTNFQNSKYYSETKKNITTTFSNDMNLIDDVLDLQIYKADSIKFKEIFVDNSGAKDRFTVPGPSDYYLHGIVYYSLEEMEKIIDEYTIIDWDDSKIQENKSSFMFDWLDEKTKTEFLESNADISIYYDVFLSKNRKCMLYFLNNKILFKISST